MKFTHSSFILASLALLLMGACNNTPPANTEQEANQLIPVIFDTDANNELDDQHALAYLLLNDEVFSTIGITVNATRSGGAIGEHVKEAQRVVELCGLKGKIPVYAGADGDFPEIRETLSRADYDGHKAVDFIIKEAMKQRDQKLVFLPVGKLTNIALALEKEPAIADKIRVVWLGANYPKPGEYNLNNDTASMNYVLSTNVPFEMVTVRYGDPSGTSAVMVSREEVNEKMPGLGPQIEQAVTGRHGGSFTNFGDYSVNLFSHIHLDEGKYRSLFDMAAVAIVKDPGWASSVEIPCPVYVDEEWLEQPDNPRKILIWENFKRDEIIADFYAAFD
jgi:inosine-uridine nucleoside N-ribohydrolase